jgi:histidyl-tRNA synthetase
VSDLQGVRGTRDVYPDEMRLRSWLFSHFRAAAQLHGFEEYDAPVLEHEALYTRKAGEDIVGQLYGFEDKGGRRVALRPEMTPSLARMVLARAGALPLPIKWFSIPQCWRYERMQRGRGREHYQWNVDIWGSAGVEADVELLAVLCSFFGRVGLAPAEVSIRVSSRKVLQEVLDSVGVAGEQFAAVCIVVDKLGKLPPDEATAQLGKLGLDDAAVTTIQRVLGLRDLDALAAALGDDSGAVAELRSLWALAEGYGLTKWLEFDGSIVRGLAYYTGPVFEAHDRSGELRAVCGGGRYDRLLSSFGGKDLPATGFGFGDMVILELLKDRDRLPQLAGSVQDVVFALNPELRPVAMDVAGRLRAQGRSVDLVLEEKRLKWALKHADRCGAERLLLLAPKEWERGLVKVRDLASGAESEVAPDAL